MVPAEPLTEKEIRELRVEFEGLIERLDNVSSRSFAAGLAWVKAKEAKHWLGEALKEIGSEVTPPYDDKSALERIEKENA